MPTTGPYFYLTKKVHDVLKSEYEKNSKAELTAKRIAEIIIERYRDDCQEKINRSRSPLLKGKTVDSARGDLEFQIKAQILIQQERIKKYPNIDIDFSVKPRLFVYNEKGAQSFKQEEDDKKIKKEEDKQEKLLYPILQQYLYYYSGYEIFSRHIPHEGSRSPESGANKWLHPDLVGLQDMQNDYMQDNHKNDEMISLMKNLGSKRFKFWSFEVKPEINIGNVRESFFQTVANSFWANFAYLVATKITGEDADKELRWLANLHGVGFIRLDKNDTSNSDIIIPAKEREKIDWNMFYRLIGSNKKYNDDYLYLANAVIDSNKMRKLKFKDWDIEEIETDE